MRPGTCALEARPPRARPVRAGRSGKWSARRTLVFIVCASGLMWASIVWIGVRYL